MKFLNFRDMFISVDEFELKLDELASIAGLPKDRVVEIKRIGKILKG